MSAVVVKCGGSLLNLPDLEARLKSVLDQFSPEPIALVCGGGEAANLVRTWDHQFNLGPDRAHDLAIAAMSFNARLLLALSSRFQWCSTLEELESSAAGSVRVIDAVTMIRQLEQSSSRPLERSWNVTSDSIAAWIATSLKAKRLVLLKSVDAVQASSPRSLALAELVDPMFPDYAAAIPSIDWINLRDDQFCRTSISG